MNFKYMSNNRDWMSLEMFGLDMEGKEDYYLSF